MDWRKRITPAEVLSHPFITGIRTQNHPKGLRDWDTAGAGRWPALHKWEQTPFPLKGKETTLIREKSRTRRVNCLSCLRNCAVTNRDTFTFHFWHLHLIEIVLYCIIFTDCDWLMTWIGLGNFNNWLFAYTTAMAEMGPFTKCQSQVSSVWGHSALNDQKEMDDLLKFSVGWGASFMQVQEIHISWSGSNTYP